MQANRRSNLEKQLSEENIKRGKSEAKSQELQSTVTRKSEEMKLT